MFRRGAILANATYRARLLEGNCRFVARLTLIIHLTSFEYHYRFKDALHAINESHHSKAILSAMNESSSTGSESGSMAKEQPKNQPPENLSALVSLIIRRPVLSALDSPVPRFVDHEICQVVFFTTYCVALLSFARDYHVDSELKDNPFFSQPYTRLLSVSLLLSVMLVFFVGVNTMLRVINRYASSQEPPLIGSNERKILFTTYFLIIILFVLFSLIVLPCGAMSLLLYFDGGGSQIMFAGIVYIPALLLIAASFVDIWRQYHAKK
jgi:hypothetical protein